MPVLQIFIERDFSVLVRIDCLKRKIEDGIFDVVVFERVVEKNPLGFAQLSVCVQIASLEPRHIAVVHPVIFLPEIINYTINYKITLNKFILYPIWSRVAHLRSRIGLLTCETVASRAAT